MSLNPFPGAFQKRARKVLLAVLPAFFMLSVTFAGNASPAPDASKQSHGETGQEPLLTMGKVIVASPDIRDARFVGAVILLLDHSTRGSAGLIVNRPMGTRIGAALPDVKGLKGRRDSVFYGGSGRPDRAMALVRSEKAPSRSLKIFDSVYIGAGKGFFDGLMDNLGPKDEFRVYSGYVKWEHHELDWEVSAGDWKVMDATPEIVFAREPEELWHRLAR